MSVEANTVPPRPRHDSRHMQTREFHRLRPFATSLVLAMTYTLAGP